MKLYNSNKIIKAIRGNKQKFDTLKVISQEILEVRKLKKQQEEFVEKSYNVVLKNLASSKKEVAAGNTTYSVSKSGISRKQSNFGTNAENIIQGSFFKALVDVRKNSPAFLKVLSPSKRTIFKKFMEKAALLDEKKATMIPVTIEIDWVNGKRTIDMLRVSYSQLNDIVIIFGSNDWSSDKVKTIHLDFEDYATIEQLYNQIKRILETELKQNTKELENMKKFLADIDGKFSKYIQSVETLNELRKGN